MKRLIPVGVMLFLASSPAPAQVEDADPLMAAYRQKTQAVRRCDRSGDTIVVCGTQAERNARERLPLPRAPEEGATPLPGDVPRASAVAVRQGSCGVIGGQGAGCVGGLDARKILSEAVKAISGD
ncbi:hypothetical protein [Sphingobium sp. HWE2-09]|uniref:hypothetical protein n=1 Tax=Sphingobium sp. HWE2-09 TaxID=3108390 RepID=UPI002DC15399|nr:hypothetical protein [Sphingobium sp. HWE2-09]